MMYSNLSSLLLTSVTDRAWKHPQTRKFAVHLLRSSVTDRAWKHQQTGKFVVHFKNHDMSETKRIADQLQRAYQGRAWHGPSLLEILADVTAVQANAQPIPKVHSIQQLVLHIAAWMDAVRERIENGPVVEPADGDWPLIADTSEAGWQQTLALLAERQQALLGVIANLTDEQLNQRLGTAHDPVTASGYSAYYNLHGVIQHSLYHAGQIVLLKKLLA